MIKSIVGMLKGAPSNIHLNEKQLKLLSKLVEEKNPEGARIIRNLANMWIDPSVDIAIKSKANYAIAGIRLNSGETPRGNLVLSVVNPSAPQVKARAHIGTSDGSAFFDHQNFDNKIPYNVYSNVRKEGEHFEVAARYGDTAGAHIKGNKDDMRTLKDWLLPNNVTEIMLGGRNKFLEFLRGLTELNRM